MNVGEKKSGANVGRSPNYYVFAYDVSGKRYLSRWPVAFLKREVRRPVVVDKESQRSMGF